MNKKILLPLFVLIAMAQLYVPAKMILDREDVLATGIEYKFRTAPVDPYDPFRGKYITLSFVDNNINVENRKDWKSGEPVYVLLENDKEGYAQFKSVSKIKPNEKDYLKTTVSYVNSKNTMRVDCPFNRFYMEESKALEAEKTYRASRRDTTQIAYAVVSIKNGEAVLKDVMINGRPIREIVKEKQQSE